MITRRFVAEDFYTPIRSDMN